MPKRIPMLSTKEIKGRKKNVSTCARGSKCWSESLYDITFFFYVSDEYIWNC